jgi:hypothetical protein
MDTSGWLLFQTAGKIFNIKQFYEELHISGKEKRNTSLEFLKGMASTVACKKAVQQRRL